MVFFRKETAMNNRCPGCYVYSVVAHSYDYQIKTKMGSGTKS